MVKEVIVLAGGRGTRLKSVVKEVPKPMAEVNGRPFLEYLLDYLIDQGIERAVLSVGYKYEIVIGHFKNRYKSLEVDYIVENEPLGTGGAIALALESCRENTAAVLNGDSLFRIDLRGMADFHHYENSILTLGLKYMKHADRYGLVLHKEGKIHDFLEKKLGGEGYINGGVYIISTELSKRFPDQKRFSFEQDVLEALNKELCFRGFVSEGYFIDIGIPKDYSKFIEENSK